MFIEFILLVRYHSKQFMCVNSSYPHSDQKVGHFTDEESEAQSP